MAACPAVSPDAPLPSPSREEAAGTRWSPGESPISPREGGVGGDEGDGTLPARPAGGAKAGVAGGLRAARSSAGGTGALLGPASGTPGAGKAEPAGATGPAGADAAGVGTTGAGDASAAGGAGPGAGGAGATLGGGAGSMVLAVDDTTDGPGAASSNGTGVAEAIGDDTGGPPAAFAGGAGVVGAGGTADVAGAGATGAVVPGGADVGTGAGGCSWPGAGSRPGGVRPPAPCTSWIRRMTSLSSAWVTKTRCTAAMSSVSRRAPWQRPLRLD